VTNNNYWSEVNTVEDCFSNAVVISEIKLKQNLNKTNAKQCFVSVKLFCFSFVSACLPVKQNAETKQK